MLRIAAILLLSGLIASCAWSPDRDNPFDPGSPGYRFVQANRAPVIDTVLVRTHCEAHPELDNCSLDLLCLVTDSDDNITPHTLKLAICQDETLGLMDYNADLGMYVLTSYRDSLPNGGSTPLSFRVIIEDDSGARDEGAARLEHWVQFGDYPVLSFPNSSVWPPDRFVAEETRFSWRPIDTLQTQSLRIKISYYGLYLVFDTSNISVQDTSILINYEFRDAAFTGDWYSWRLIGRDQDGNTAASMPGMFQYFGEPELTDGNQNQSAK